MRARDVPRPLRETSARSMRAGVGLNDRLLRSAMTRGLPPSSPIQI